jgi:hypothetical protein
MQFCSCPGIVKFKESAAQSVSLGTKVEQNPYTAELEAIAVALGSLPVYILSRQITIFTCNQGAVLAISQPRHQSGQNSIGRIYTAVSLLREQGNFISAFWTPSESGYDLSKKAKISAREATELGRLPQGECYQAKSTTINSTIAAQRRGRTLAKGVGKYSREMNTRSGNLSYHLGGKSLSDTDQWTPNMNAVRATIKFSMATGRLDTETTFS